MSQSLIALNDPVEALGFEELGKRRGFGRSLERTN